jgi:hypothetical protein
MLTIVTSRETSKTVVVTASKQKNCDNLNNMRHKASKYSRNKKRQHLKDKINNLKTNCINKNIRNLYGSNLVKDNNGNWLVDYHNILNVCKYSNITQIEIHTVEPLVPDPSLYEVELLLQSLKSTINHQ